MPVWGWLSCCVYGGRGVSCGVVGCERDRFMGDKVVYGVPLGSLCKFTFDWAVRNARSLSMSTFWELTYLLS